MRLIEKIWFHQHIAKWLIVPLLLPLTLLFWLLSSIRRLGFKLGLIKSYQVSKPVIVVGNIGIGGNGKTPIVIHLVELCRSLKLTPGVISRGYGGKAPHYPYLVTADSSATEAGDEPILIFDRCQVPIAIGSDRIASCNLLIEQDCNIIISDDGLQHYKLKRDLELIIVDGKRLFGNGLLLPAGPLREGKWRLPQSDLVIYNGSTRQNAQPEIKADIQPLQMQLNASNVFNLKTGECVSITDFLRNSTSVNAIAGIGAPQRFFDTLIQHGFMLLNQQDFIDHHSFVHSDFNHFDDSIPLLMTEKDAVKCKAFSKHNWWYLPVDADFSKPDLKILSDKVKSISTNTNQYKKEIT